jgi:hypothetical protein
MDMIAAKTNWLSVGSMDIATTSKRKIGTMKSKAAHTLRASSHIMIMIMGMGADLNEAES